MNILLISRQNSVDFRKALCNDELIWAPVCVNHPMEALFYLNIHKNNFDFIVLVEQDRMQEEIESFVRYIKQLSSIQTLTKLLIFTRNKELFDNITKSKLENVSLYFIDDVKISPSMILNNLKRQGRHEETNSKGVYKIFKKSKNHDLDKYLVSKVQYLQKNMMSTTKVLGFSGYNGAGTTSTAANFAYLASMVGFKTFLIDFDFEKRGQNLYYPKFGQEVDANRLMGDSVLNVMKCPDDFEKNSCRINENLFLTTLSYSFEFSYERNKSLIDEKKMALFFHVLKEKSDLVVLDLPLYSLKKLEGLSNYVDKFGFCVNNNLYSLISSANELSKIEDFVFFRKASLIVTKFNCESMYNARPLSLNVCLMLLDNFIGKRDCKLEILGSISFLAEFDKLLDAQKRIVNYSKKIKKDYLDLLEGMLA